MADWRTVCVKRKTPGCYRGLPRSVSPSAVLEHGPPLEPRNGLVTDSIRPADIGQRLAGLAACNGFLNLEWTQLWLASEPDAPCLRWHNQFAFIGRLKPIGRIFSPALRPVDVTDPSPIRNGKNVARMSIITKDNNAFPTLAE